MSTLKNKMAGKLSGSMKSTEDRLAKAEAVMASGGLMQAAKAVEQKKVEQLALLEPETALPKKQKSKLEAAGATAPKTVAKAPKVTSSGDSLKKGGEKVAQPTYDPASGVGGILSAGQVRVQRETFTMLPAESEKIDEIRTLAASKKLFTTRSAIVRAGILALHSLKGEQLMNVLKQVPEVKPGRKA